MSVISKDTQDNSEKPSFFRLRIYYYLLEILGAIIPIAIAVSIIFFPTYFTWFGEYTVAGTIVLFSIGIIQSLFFILHEIFKKNLFFSMARYFYLVFFICIIYFTGNINSSFIFLLFFPIITTAVYLDKKTTKNIGIVVTLVLASMILFIPTNEITPALILKHSIQVILTGVLSYLVYSVVIETLRQRYEKEETDKRLGEMMQVDRLKSDFLSVAQHQLRTPLSGVKWALEILKNEPKIPPESMELIDAGIERIKDAIGIINGMLKTIEAEGETLILNREKLDIVGIVRSIIAELHFITIKKGIKLTFITPDSIIINGDKNKLKAAIINIIDNALKYSPYGKVNVTITEGETSVKIETQDTGIGINPSDIPYIFERLHRGKNAVMVEPDESGVGLYTSKKMIELHSGSIAVTSELNKGTKVTVILPKG